MLKKLKLTVLWRPTRPSRTNSQTRYPFHYRGLECKSRKSRATWRNRQIWPWSANRSRAKAKRVVCFVFNLLGPLLIIRFLKWNVTSWFCHQPAKLRVTPPPTHFPTEGRVPRLFSFPTLFLVSPTGSLSSVSCPAHNNHSGLWFGQMNELLLPTLTKVSRIPYNPKLLTLGVAFLFPGAQDVNGWALGVKLSA